MSPSNCCQYEQFVVFDGLQQSWQRKSCSLIACTDCVYIELLILHELVVWVILELMY